MPGLDRCVRCASLLDFAGISVLPLRAGRVGPLVRLGRRLGRRLQPLRQRWHAAGDRLDGFLGQWSHTLALQADERRALRRSLIPGLGVEQHRPEDRALRRVLGGNWAALLLGSLLCIGLPSGQLLLSGAVVVHGAAVLLVLRRSLAQWPLGMRVLAGLLVFLVLRFGLYAPPIWLGEQLLRPVQLQLAHPAELVADGEVVWVEGPWLRPRSFRRGDLVLYHIPYIGRAGMIVRQGLGLDRVVGVAGDVVEVSGGVLRVNGRQPPPAEATLGELSSLPDMRLELAEGEQAIFPSLLLLRLPRQASRSRDGLALLDELSRVRDERVVGQVRWRSWPWSRFGRVKGGS
ncbi:MAG: hypothetical protein FJ125_08515 [Deltaproteobacteria bacterium]|nr:hypothetical protein [Deltaproteobacteria bacterium]